MAIFGSNSLDFWSVFGYQETNVYDEVFRIDVANGTIDGEKPIPFKCSEPWTEKVPEPVTLEEQHFENGKTTHENHRSVTDTVLTSRPVVCLF